MAVMELVRYPGLMKLIMLVGVFSECWMTEGDKCTAGLILVSLIIIVICHFGFDLDTLPQTSFDFHKRQMTAFGMMTGMLAALFAYSFVKTDCVMENQECHIVERFEWPDALLLISRLLSLVMSAFLCKEYCCRMLIPPPPPPVVKD